MHLRMLTAEVGPIGRPISRVVGAELLLTARTLTARVCPQGGPTVAGGCDTSYTVTGTTTFVPLEASSFEYVPEAPQLIPPLPYDFFYPFFIDTRDSRSR